MKAVKIISVLFLVLFVSSISVSEIVGQDKETARPTEKIEKSDARKTDDTGKVQNSSQIQDNERYLVGYQDTLEVNVFKHPELSLNVAVNPDGTIYLPRIDKPVVAACKTEGELKDDITALYKKNYLRDPFVSVRLSSQQSQPFAVIGAVKKPGNFYLNRQVRLLELLSLAGGPDVEFAGGKIQLARVGSVSNCKESVKSTDENGEVIFSSYRLKDVLEGKQNPWMQPGDIISIAQSEEAYVVGNVVKPTKILLREPVTLTTAIARAEGTNKNAQKDKVVIQRQDVGSSVKTELVFNLKDIRDKKIPDPVLQANDIVVVGTDKLKSFGSGVLKTITGTIPQAIYRIP